MARKYYDNGDPITLIHCGCDGCAPMMIGKVLCHEIGCPDRWRDDMELMNDLLIDGRTDGGGATECE